MGAVAVQDNANLMYAELQQQRKKRKNKAQAEGIEATGEEDQSTHKQSSRYNLMEKQVDIEDEEDDPQEERRRIFGEEESLSEDNSEKEAEDSDDSVGRDRDEDEDEFMIVLQAVRERKRYEAELSKPMLKDKLSQTGWKLKENFLKRQNAFIDDKDRVDVFDSSAANLPVEKGGILAVLDKNY